MTAAPQRQNEKRLLKRELGLVDLTLFYIAGGLSLRWIATAAAAGPGTILIWIFACLCFFVPLAASVLELSARYPQEGGLYVWTQHAFGDFGGFMAAWSYWMSNLPYFPAVLYFGASSLLFAVPHGQRLQNTSSYYLVFAIASLGLIMLLNIRGLRYGKWLNSVGALGSWLPVLCLLLLGVVTFFRYGSATQFTAATMTPHLDLKHAMFWSTIFFAFGGCESGSFMSEEIEDARRTIPQALIVSGIVLAISYIAGTVALLVALPRSAISGLSGFTAVIQGMSSRFGLSWLSVLVALLVALSSIGGAASFLSSTSRLPFVAGIDRYLPAFFGRVHARWGTPWVAIFSYGMAGILCTLFSQAGTSVKSAYNLLVSMSIITYFIPFAFLFLAMIRLQRTPAPPGVTRIPGGRPAAIFLASMGLATTLLTIFLSLFPSDDEPHPVLAVIKLLGSAALLISAGAGLFYSSKWRRNIG
ncbi:MAG TPA: APC family permease [Acidobacteriaceae bacterium]|nr:APC family permease [Acidobacteriaceae bacterium]